MYSEAWVLRLKMGQGVVGVHRPREGARCRPKLVVERLQPVERQFDGKQVEGRLLQYGPDLLHRTRAIPTVGRYIDLSDTVALDEVSTDFGKFASEKGFPAGEIQRFYLSKLP